MSEKIAQNIRVLLARKNCNLTWLAKQTGITIPNISVLLSRLEKGGGANINTLEKIAKALEVEISEIVK